ncbi:MAG: cysteine desulfurase [Ruminococcaceae bacterium]|nr:cysteine desulfurase [Oscillospiraceae bacterium]
MLKTYADYAATTPLSERVFDTLCRTSREVFGNPSSAHSFGRDAADVVSRAREQTAALLGCDPDEIVFTSGGTEADNHALRCAAGMPVLISAIEHPAVLNAARAMASRVYFAEPDSDGCVSAEEIAHILRGAPEIAMVSLMYANNETGVIQPVREAADAAHAAGALFHCDAVQGTGHVMPDVRTLDCDLLSVSGHKFHAPKGIGALYVNRRIAGRIPPFHYGGGQEHGLRSGTLPVPLIAAFGEACAEALERRDDDDRRIRCLRDRMADELLTIPGSRRIGQGRTMPGILNIAFEGTYGENLMLLCDLRGVSLSTGSACHAGDDTPSHVLTAMRVPEEYRTSSVRISIGRYTTDEEAERITETLRDCVMLARG